MMTAIGKNEQIIILYNKICRKEIDPLIEMIDGSEEWIWDQDDYSVYLAYHTENGPIFVQNLDVSLDFIAAIKGWYDEENYALCQMLLKVKWSDKQWVSNDNDILEFKRLMMPSWII